MNRNFNIPYNAYIGLTYSCNCHCKHCYAHNRMNLERPMISKEDFIQLLHHLRELGTLSVTYSHGETLLYPHYRDIFRHAHDLGFTQVLISNGILLSHEVGVNLEALGIDVLLLSIDSLDEHEHDENRGRMGCFSALIDAIDVLRQLNITTKGLAITIAKRNQHKVGDIIDYAIQHGINYISLLSERSNALSTLPDVEVITDIIKCYGSRVHIVTHDCRLNNSLSNSAFMTKKEKAIFISNNECIVGNQISIDAYGDVRLCNFLEEVVGNIKTQSLISIWNSILTNCDNKLYECGINTQI